MTAINIYISKPLKTVFVCADAARYTPDGIVTELATKLFSIPHFPGIVAVRGVAVAGPILGDEIASKFATFDAAVAGIEDALPEMVGAWRDLHGRPIELILAGWSHDRDQPEAYVINTTADLPVCTTVEQVAASEHHPPPFTLHRLPDHVDGPGITDLDVIIAANWEGIEPDANDATITWSMLKFMEMQRQVDFGDGIHWIGGFCQLAFVTPDGVAQTIMRRWNEDQPGELLKPTPINWDEWHASNPKPMPNNPIQLSRVRQDMLERKRRKAMR